jgi:hypothetical protein
MLSHLGPTPSPVKTTLTAVARPPHAAAPLTRAAFATRLVLIVGLVNVVLLGLVLHALDHSQHRYETQADTITQNLSRVLAGHIADSFARIDLTVRTVVDEVEQQLVSTEGINAAKLNAFIDRHFKMLPILDGLRVITAEGDIPYGIGVNPSAIVNVADRPYFQRLRNDPQAGLVISEPVLGRVSKKWTLILSRRINRPDGSFAGVVNGSIALDQFAATFATVDVGAKGSIALRNADL